jgi:lycopene beta-cyclase
MSEPQTIDLVILGAGCAGLSLARKLAVKKVTGTVMLIEPRHTYQDDRSWCFWESEQHALSDWVSYSWPIWSFSKTGQAKQSRHLSGYSYQYIRSIDFYRNSLTAIGSWPAITLKLGQAVQTVEKKSSHWEIATDQGETYRAHQVLDTRSLSSESLDQATLLQCFAGVEIELEDGTQVDPGQIELMTQMQIVNDEFCFTYVLPYTPTRLLVELTYFARSRPDRAELEQQLAQVLAQRGWSGSKVVRTEYGELPMGLPTAQTDDGQQPPRAGMRAGALRASSGYGFLRIQRWAERCAEHYCQHGEVLAEKGSGYWLQKMDQIFLNVLRANPALAPDLFDTLLGKIEPRRFIRFMNDQASFSDCIRIVACMPKVPFIKALIRGAGPRS